eukprot:5380548-Amphidinium_carterae.1
MLSSSWDAIPTMDCAQTCSIGKGEASEWANIGVVMLKAEALRDWGSVQSLSTNCRSEEDNVDVRSFAPTAICGATLVVANRATAQTGTST